MSSLEAFKFIQKSGVMNSTCGRLKEKYRLAHCKHGNCPPYQIRWWKAYKFEYDTLYAKYKKCEMPKLNH